MTDQTFEEELAFDLGRQVCKLLQNIARDLRATADRIDAFADEGAKQSLSDLKPEWTPVVAYSFSRLRSLVGNMVEFDQAMQMAAEHDAVIRSVPRRTEEWVERVVEMGRSVPDCDKHDSNTFCSCKVRSLAERIADDPALR